MDEHVLAAVVLGDEAVALRFAFIYEALRMSLFFGHLGCVSPIRIEIAPMVVLPTGYWRAPPGR